MSDVVQIALGWVARLIGCIVAGIVGLAVYDWSRKRADVYTEYFPFHNTVRGIVNQNRFLDFILDAHAIMEPILGKKSLSSNIFGLPQFVFTNDIENVTYILKTNFDNFGKGPLMKYRFQGLLGDGIFNVDGPKWYHHRKTSSHLFNLNKFRSTILDTFNEHMNIVVEKLMATNGESSDFQSLMFKFTLDSIGKIAFGFDIGSLTKEKVQFADDFDYCQHMANVSFCDPLWVIWKYFTPVGYKFYQSLQRVDKFAYGVVQRRRQQVDEEFRQREVSRQQGQTVSSCAIAEAKGEGDLLGLYLMRQKKMSTGGDKTGDDDDDKPILNSECLSSKWEGSEMNAKVTSSVTRISVINFVIAGRDTTAQALSWTFYRLCMHPAVQAKVREEIATVRAAEPELDCHSFDFLAKLKYMEAMCMEVLRLHPSVPKEAKYCYKDDTLPDGTKVYKGDMVIFCPWVMGRQECLWENAMEFKPERFLNNAKPSPFVYTAFQAGPRMCLGRNLALLEMKCCISRLLQTFEFSFGQDPSLVTYANTLTLPIKGKLMLKAQPVPLTR